MTVDEFEKRAAYQGGYDRTFAHWKIIDIHHIPSEISAAHEIDFYCSNGVNVYLVRLRNRATEYYELIDNSENRTLPIYLIAEFPIQYINDAVLEAILSKNITN